jgi:SAM-dependent methyltransferase
MNIIKDNKINLYALSELIAKPEIFAKGTAKFWDDEHISAQMLKLHLNPAVEAASKTKETIEAEASFIIGSTGMGNGKTVLDLGCGPGLYVKEFAKTGAKVKGIDLSARSIDYADENIKPERHNVTFAKMNYLDMTFQNAFDIATLIFYDFGALNTEEQGKLLANVHRALKNNGVFVFDVISTNWQNPLSAGITVNEAGGFWRPGPYIEILTAFSYENPRTEGRQYAIIGEDGDAEVVRIYIRLFGMEEIVKLLNEHNFRVEKVYSNLKGDPLGESPETYGIIARKG